MRLGTGRRRRGARGRKRQRPGCLERGAVDQRRDPSNQGDTRDVSLDVDVDVHSHIAAGTGAGSARREGRLLLFQHRGRIHRSGRRRRDILRAQRVAGTHTRERART